MKTNRAVLVTVSYGKWDESRIFESERLIDAYHLNCVYSFKVLIRKEDPSTFIGYGKVEELKRILQEYCANIAVFDVSISARQIKNLESITSITIMDRVALILHIFSQRARTFEGRLQVDLAMLTYQRSRLIRSWTHLERQRGGLGFIGGSGEGQLELDRRIISRKITYLKKKIEHIRDRREIQRKQRKKSQTMVFALVGYTNVGKSSIFNYLTRSSVPVEDKLFCTLDPTIRQIILPSKRSVVIIDSVGFVSDLPVNLIAAFRATLEEIIEADVLIHVYDLMSHFLQEQQDELKKTLQELGVSSKKHIIVFNKADRWSGSQLINKDHIFYVSALNGFGMKELSIGMDSILSENMLTLDLSVPLDQGKQISWLHKHSFVENTMEFNSELRMRIHITKQDFSYYKSYFQLN